MLKLPIYLDYSSTTPIDPYVKEQMLRYMAEDFGNPASRSHSFGWTAENAVEHAREQVAQAISADPREIIWTSGATESNNLAIKGAAHFYQEKGKHIITVQTEHKAVLDCCRQLETEGFRVTYITPHSNGLIDLDLIASAREKDTILISVMHVNNEIGVIQPLQDIGAFCREHGILFHVDAAQTIGKIPLNVETIQASLVSLSAHKAYGPKGIGALYVRRKPRVRLTPLIHGGGHERGLRSGTLPTHQIVGMGAAYEKAVTCQEKDYEQARALQAYFIEHIQHISAIQFNGDLTQRVPHNINVSFKFVEGESLMMALKNIAVSSGSACTSSSLEPSYVLKSLGCPDELAHSSIRFSFGRFTTEEEIAYTCTLIQEKVDKLRAISPLWEMHLKGIDVEKFDWQTLQHG